jgi:hypothetical protein
MFIGLITHGIAWLLLGLLRVRNLMAAAPPGLSTMVVAAPAAEFRWHHRQRLDDPPGPVSPCGPYRRR